MAKKRSRHDEKTNYDVEVALALQERYNPLGVTENAVFPEDVSNYPIVFQVNITACARFDKKIMIIICFS